MWTPSLCLLFACSFGSATSNPEPASPAGSVRGPWAGGGESRYAQEPRSEASAAPRVELGLSSGWRYVDFEADEAPADPEQLAASADLLWTRVGLPAGTPQPAAPTVRWYSKSFELPEPFPASTHRIAYRAPEGVHRVWLDGRVLSVAVDGAGSAGAEFAADELAPGGHELLVRVESGAPGGRRFGLDGAWRLHARPELHLADDGVGAVGVCSASFDADTAPCRLQAAVVNGSPVLRRVRVHFVCRAPDGRVLADVISPPAELAPGARQAFEVEPPWDLESGALRGPGEPPLAVEVELVEYAQIVDRRRLPFAPLLATFEPEFNRFGINGQLRLLRGAVLDTTGSLAEQSDRALLRDLQRLAQLGLDLVVLEGRRETLLDRVDAGGPLVLQRIGGELLPAPFLRATGVAEALARELAPEAADEAGGVDSGLLASLTLPADADRRDGARAMAAAARGLVSDLVRSGAPPGSPADRGPALLLHRRAISGAGGSGLLDAWRTPNFAAQLLRSQAPPERDPVCYPASAWNGPLEGPLEVYSNADEVRVFVNGVLRAALTAGTPGARVEPPSEALPFPPFRFPDLRYEPGELRVVGYADGRPIAERVARTPGEPASVVVLGETLDVPLMADGTDAVYVHAIVLDELGGVCTNFAGELEFQTSGRATLIGPARVRARAGLATSAVRAGTQPGPALVAADLGRISSATLQLDVVPAEPLEL